MSSVTRTLTRLCVLPAATAAIALSLVSPASAHVSATVSDASAGAFTVATFSVPHGCEESPTTKIEIQVPESVLSVTPTRNPFYDVESEDRGARRARDRRPRQRGHRAHRIDRLHRRTRRCPTGSATPSSCPSRCPTPRARCSPSRRSRPASRARPTGSRCPRRARTPEELEHPAPSFEILPASAEGDHHDEAADESGEEPGDAHGEEACAPRPTTRTAPTPSAGPASARGCSAWSPVDSPWPGAARPRDPRRGRQVAPGPRPGGRPAGRARGRARLERARVGARRADRHRPRRRAPSWTTAPADGDPDLQRAGPAHRAGDHGLRRRRRDGALVRRRVRHGGPRRPARRRGARPRHLRRRLVRAVRRRPPDLRFADLLGRRAQRRVVEPPPAPDVVSRVGHGPRACSRARLYVGLLVAAGLALFVALVLPAAPAGQQVRRRIRRVAGVAAAVAAVGMVLQVPVASAYGQGLELGDLVSALRSRRSSSTSCLGRSPGARARPRRGRPHRPAAHPDRTGGSPCWPAARCSR